MACVAVVGNLGVFVQVSADTVPDIFLYNGKSVRFNIALDCVSDIAYSRALADSGDALEKALLGYVYEFFCLFRTRSGFASVTYFLQAFSATFGKTPKTWRASRMNLNGSSSRLQ